MNTYYMKKFKRFADFIIECLQEKYTNTRFTRYELEEEYNKVTIKLYIKINAKEYTIRIPCDFNIPIAKILQESICDINQIILNCYK